MTISTPTTLAGEKLMQFEFATAGRILFGCGALNEIGALARSLGSRALIITSNTVSRAQRLQQRLATVEIQSHTFSLAGEPTLADVLRAREESQRIGCDLIIGFGGGSP